MRATIVVLIATAAIPVYQAARAFPDGAPWGAANPDASENCAGCHFDNEATRNSSALTVAGLPEILAAGTQYNLVVNFQNPGGRAAGFQMIAAAGEQSAGTFLSDAENTEVAGAAIRSTAPIVQRGSVSWAVQWRTPKDFDRVVKIYVAASAANDDQSPFGDTIHFRSYEFAGTGAGKAL